MIADITFHRGLPKKPAVVFIHGLGMDKSVWENPLKSRMLAGSMPISILFSQRPAQRDFGFGRKRHQGLFHGITTGIRPEQLKSPFDDMKSLGYPVAAWSQKRPVGPIDEAVEELKEVLDYVNASHRGGFILVGHSRGGLIAGRYLFRRDRRVRGIVTICTPHRGSSLARLAVYMSPLSSALYPLLPEKEDKGRFRKVIKRMVDFLESKAVRELLPDSGLFAPIPKNKMQGVRCLTIGGTNPCLFSLYRWKLKASGKGPDKRRVLYPEEIFSIPGIFEKIIPGRLSPAEFKMGMGDGIVTAESSEPVWCRNHHNFPLNHAAILFDEKSRELIRKTIEDMS